MSEQDNNIPRGISPAPFKPPVERRHSVLTETDLHAIARVVAATLPQHQCRFEDIDAKDLEMAVTTVLATRRAAFWAGATFAGAMLVIAAGGCVWLLKEAVKAALRAAGTGT